MWFRLAIRATSSKNTWKRGRYKQTKERNLVERLIKYQDAILAFVFNGQVHLPITSLKEISGQPK